MSGPPFGPPDPAAEEELAPPPALASPPEHATGIEVQRNLLFLGMALASIVVFLGPLRTLVNYALWVDKPFDQYSYTLAIPFIGVALVYLEQRRIFAHVKYGAGAGLALLLSGGVLSWLAVHYRPRLGADNSLSASILALVICWLGAFVLCYGSRALRAGAFPFLFLLLSVPIPDRLLDLPVTAVRYGSTEVCALIFSLAGIPVLHSGFEFFLAHTSIEVAQECSGIHSTLAIFIISLIAGHLFLASVWRKVLLVIFALPIVCATNGLRIAGLTLLAEYVNPSFLRGSLHREGGMGFFVLALLLLTAILQLLRRGQEQPAGATGRPVNKL